MDYPVLNQTIKTLRIGEFNINFSRNIERLKSEIPLTGMAFYQPGSHNPDFTYTIDKVEKDSSGKRLFGSEDFMIPTFIYKRDSGYYDYLTTDHDGKPKLSFRISSDWTEFTLYEDNTDTNGERAFHEFGSIFSYAVLNHNACVLHGVVMEHDGRGILVAAASGAGKSTHTRMWRDNENALIINGDRCLCRKIDNKWYAYGMPWAGSSGEYINRRVIITAIVALKRGEQNETRRMSVFESAIYLMQRVFAPKWRCEMQTAALDLTQNIAEIIPVIELKCRPDLDSVATLKKAIDEL